MRRVGAFSFNTCPNLCKSSNLQTTKVLSDLCFLKKRKKITIVNSRGLFTLPVGKPFKVQYSCSSRIKNETLH